jgi:hypothetical protein
MSRHRAAIAVTALALAAVTFVYRFNTLGGALGGFDNDHFIYLIRTDMVLAGEQPLRDFADAELRGAWPALTYEVSGWAQRLWGPTLLSEAFLTTGALALATAVVFFAAMLMSSGWLAGLLAALVTIATTPKLYNYPKVLMLAAAAWALLGVIRQPTKTRLFLLALITAAAALFRHDLGMYIGAAAVIGLALRDTDAWRSGLQHAAVYVAACALLLLPSAIWVQIYEGIPSYVWGSMASVQVEQARTQLYLPPLDLAAPFAGESLLLITYYAFWAVPAVALVALVARVISRRSCRMPESQWAIGAALFIMAVLADKSFLRANLAERFGDAAAPVVLLAAWTAAAASTFSTALARRAFVVLPTLLLFQMVTAAYSFSDMDRELDTAGLSQSWDKVARRYQSVRDDLGRLPPASWRSVDQGAGVLGAAEYVAECTEPSDRLLVTGATHEVPVLARRRFAGGQAMFKLSLYTSERDQQRALERLEQQSVPVVLADVRDDGDDGFLTDYPLIASYILDRYSEAGTIQVDQEPRLRILVERARHARGRDHRFGLPCFR